MSCRFDVVLVTTDNELVEVVRRQRPSGLKLGCLAPEDVQQSSLCRGSELWVDLEAKAGDKLAERAVVCFQSPHSEFGDNVGPICGAVLVRKPCSGAVARRLWRSVTAKGQHGRGPASGNVDALPGWMNEFHEIGLRELCRLCVSRLPQRLGYRDISVYLHDPVTGILSLSETTHLHPIDAAISIAEDREHLMADVARSGRLLQTSDARREWESRQLPPRDGRHSYPDGACLIAPLMCDGQLWGVLNFSGRRRKVGAERPTVGAVPRTGGAARRSVAVGRLTRPEPIFEFIGRSLRYAREYEQARLEARIDALTGLYNQRWMKEALDKEIRRSERFAIPLALIAADLDGLKAVNDREGHMAGDCLLRHVARRISSVLRQFDSAARVGGDEFTVLLPATDLEGARHVARRILEAIRSDAALFRGVALPIRASLGVAQCEAGWDAARLIEAADQAMYMAKKQGRDQLICRAIGAAAGGSSPGATPATVDG
jgi:diguanylate cyclase (GGDEF)-like protein